MVDFKAADCFEPELPDWERVYLEMNLINELSEELLKISQELNLLHYAIALKES